MAVTWLAERTERAVREALQTVAPDMADGRIDLMPWVDNRPEWHRSSALVDGGWIVKFAWSQAAAEKLVRETQVLRVLAAACPSSMVRPLRAWSSQPALFVAPYVPGPPLDGSIVEHATRQQRAALASDVATILAALHEPGTRRAFEGVVDLPLPTPQASSVDLRARFCPMLDDARRRTVHRWCDWVDAALAPPSEAVVLHGDFHGYNLVVSPDGRVRVLLDLEEASFGDFHYDFRYLPSQDATLASYLDVAADYERRTSRQVSHERVMAWHVLTTLGDALWRTEGGVDLPHGGTVTQWIDEIAARFDALGINGSSSADRRP